MLPLVLMAVLSAPGEVKVKAIPALPGNPVVDGKLKEYAGAAVVKPFGSLPGEATFVGRVGWKKDRLYLGVEVTQAQDVDASQLQVSLFFPNAGVTARGEVFTYGASGRAGPNRGDQVAAVKSAKGYTVEVALPATTLPRFPAVDPMVLELCLAVGKVSSCHGMTPLEPLRVPDEFRKGLKLQPPENVTALEHVPAGWVGFAELHRPYWLKAEKPITVELLASLFEQTVADPAAVGVNIPRALTVEGQPLLGVVTGENPYAERGKCNADVELRVAFYKVDGQVARRVMDWPVATCQLGRAVSVSMEADTLTVGYSNGPVTTFTWVVDHFERTELGAR